MSKEKTPGQLLQEQLIIMPKNGGELLNERQIQDAIAFCEPYKTFLDKSKTEREAVNYFVEELEAQGYEKFDAAKKYAAGAKVYMNNRGKSLVMATVGTRPIEQGVRIMASHIDSPRIDLKPRPFYEQGQMGMLKTHYYGGIKKYQWTTIPLALHGVIVKKDGSVVNVNIGENAGDPLFCITDLLPHLADDQMKRKLHDGIKGEELNVVIGSLPFKDDEASERVKLNIIRMFHEKYGVTEHDFLSAELSLVPAFKAADIGLDRSMVGSYGHDDRVCAYTSFIAALEVEKPEVTHVTVFADKEEIGSDGNTGLHSSFLKYFIADLAAAHGVEARTVLSASTCLSADVSVAFDPTFPDVCEKNNTAYINYGVVLTKYTGARGKSSTNDAHAEFTAAVRNVLDKNDVLWQTGELGKVDQGGGGTVAKYVSELNVDTIDIGVPVLSMHAPYEVVSKIDTYEAYRGFKAFIAE